MFFFLGSKSEALNIIGSQLAVCQLASVLEAVHPMIGLVRTSITAPLIQVCVCVCVHVINIWCFCFTLRSGVDWMGGAGPRYTA